jgi:hypothetical protein
MNCNTYSFSGVVVGFFRSGEWASVPVLTSLPAGVDGYPQLSLF